VSVYDRAGVARNYQAGYTSITTDGTGYDTVTLPAAFPDTDYAVTANVYTTSGYWLTVTARTASTFTVRMHNASGPVLSTTRTISWHAIRF